ncbi:MAG: hypothetical protein MK095_10490, partial [Phycisphaerales bacterium]|nr:hypothetical protein [Phycisphaerales bacterium]
TIPPRKELEDLIELALEIYVKINRIDASFFDGVKLTLKLEDQLPMLERYQRQRTLGNYIMPHFMLASRINEGIQFNLIEWMQRQDLNPEEAEAVLLVTDEFEVQVLRLVRAFEDDLETIVEAVLDLVDSMGLRDMSMQQMMALAGGGDLESQMKTFFNEESKKIQKTCEKMSRLNLQTMRRLREVLTEETWTKLSMAYADDAYGKSASGVQRAHARFGRAMKLDGITEQQEAALESARADYGVAWVGLFPRVANATEDQRAYRTADQFEGDAPGDHDDKVDQASEKVERLVEGAQSSLATILTADQLALMDGEKGESGRGRWGRSSRSRRAEATPDPVTGRTYDFPVAAMEPVSIDQFSSWLNLEEVDQAVLESLYDEYTTSYDNIANSYDSRIINGYEGMEDGGGWRERRNLRRDARSDLMPQLKSAEDAFFQDMQMVLPPDTMPDLLNQIRVSHDRSRRREKIWMSNWSLRGQTEAAIDLGEIILAIDPAALDEETRADLLDVMIGYNAACAGDIDGLETAYESVQSLEGRLWSDESSEMDDDVRSLLRERWQKGRSKMTEIAARMGELNRSVYEGILARMPGDQIMPIRDLYEQKAFPDVFDDDSIANEQIDSVMGMESLTSQQRMDIGDLTLDYRGEYRTLTERMLEQVRARQKREQSWPPDADAMKSYMKMETLRFQREQLNERIRIMMEMVLTDQQIAEVPGLGRPAATGQEADS